MFPANSDDRKSRGAESFDAKQSTNLRQTADLSVIADWLKSASLCFQSIAEMSRFTRQFAIPNIADSRTSIPTPEPKPHLRSLDILDTPYEKMATLRTAGPAASSIFRFASQPTTTRRCAHCLKAQRCPFSSFRPVRQSSKRPLMTETSYRPHTLEPEMPPPPRNDNGVPETSISSGGQRQVKWPPAAPWESEKEAQKSKPTLSISTQPSLQQSQTTASPSPSPSTSTLPKKSKLRPRRAPITLTPTAVIQLRALFDTPSGPGKMIRVGVKNRGCSGLAYNLEYVEKPGAFDETVEQDGVKVLIDSKALFSIIGSEMDWKQDRLEERFVFRNPNISKFSHLPHVPP